MKNDIKDVNEANVDMSLKFQLELAFRSVFFRCTNELVKINAMT